MAIRIDENTIFEDGRMKKVSATEAEDKEEPKTSEKSDAKSEAEAEDKEEPKTSEKSDAKSEAEAEDKEEPKAKAGRKPKAPVKGKEA